MTRPMRKEPLGDEFQDPLENYEPKTFDDALEQALAEETADVIQSTPYASIAPEAPVHEAVDRLAQLHVACLLVEDGGKLVGVVSDRDVLDKVSLEYDQVKDQPVSSVMTMEPVYVYNTDTAAAVLSVMAVSGYRHVPVLSLNKTIVGVISPQRITAFLQQYFSEK